MDFFYDNKLIGKLKEGVFRKKVKKSKHLMRKFNAWGIQYDALKQLKEKGCTEIRVLEKEENIIYSVSMEDYMNKSNVEDFGDGMQAFMPLDLWTTTKNKK